jgi:CheY-like chemotaxis protein
MARVLIVEDDYIAATQLAAWLQDAGHVLIGPAADLETALKRLADKGADLALIDVGLGGRPTGVELADMLTAQRIPFAFTTGYSQHLLPAALRERPRLEKPFGRDEVLSMVERLAPATSGR